MPDTQLWVGQREPHATQFEPIENNDDLVHKPMGGLWTSTETTAGCCDWIRWADAESFYDPTVFDVWRLVPTDAVPTIVIDSTHDLDMVLNQYRRDDLDWRLHGSFAPLDFEAMAEQNTAIRLTERGQRETRMSRPGLYGWDSESVLWLEWAFESVEYVGGLDEVLAES